MGNQVSNQKMIFCESDKEYRTIHGVLYVYRDNTVKLKKKYKPKDDIIDINKIILHEEKQI